MASSIKATSQEIMRSETFFLVATMDALKAIAEANGRHFEDAVTAYKLRVPEVIEQVDKMVKRAAEEMAEGLNSATPTN